MPNCIRKFSVIFEFKILIFMHFCSFILYQVLICKYHKLFENSMSSPACDGLVLQYCKMFSKGRHCVLLVHFIAFYYISKCLCFFIFPKVKSFLWIARVPMTFFYTCTMISIYVSNNSYRGYSGRFLGYTLSNLQNEIRKWASYSNYIFCISRHEHDLYSNVAVICIKL